MPEIPPPHRPSWERRYLGQNTRKIFPNFHSATFFWKDKTQQQPQQQQHQVSSQNISPFPSIKNLPLPYLKKNSTKNPKGSGRCAPRSSRITSTERQGHLRWQQADSSPPENKPFFPQKETTVVLKNHPIFQGRKCIHFSGAKMYISSREKLL